MEKKITRLYYYVLSKARKSKQNQLFIAFLKILSSRNFNIPYGIYGCLCANIFCLSVSYIEPIFLSKSSFNDNHSFTNGNTKIYWIFLFSSS